MTPEEIDQFAACRMHVAELHQVLAALVEDLGEKALYDMVDNPTWDRACATLTRSEPEMLDIIAKARAVVSAYARDGEVDYNELWKMLGDAIDALAAALPKTEP
jgi:hypothetical protein